jgi:hypothetical protein
MKLPRTFSFCVISDFFASDRNLGTFCKSPSAPSLSEIFYPSALEEMSDSPNVQEPKRKQKNEIASCYRLSSPYREGLKSEDHPQIVRKSLKNLLPIRIFCPNIWRTPNYLRTGNKINRLKIYLTDLNGYFTFTLVIHT